MLTLTRRFILRMNVNPEEKVERHSVKLKNANQTSVLTSWKRERVKRH